MREQLAIAARDKSYWCLHAGFFTCGFHIAFLVTHLPGEVKLCSLSASRGRDLALHHRPRQCRGQSVGRLGGRRDAHEMAAVRDVLLPRRGHRHLHDGAQDTRTTFYLFAAVLGFTWLATVPPTAGLIGKLFGVRYLATLFGLATFTHQIGAFFGAWLGGIALVRFGDYPWMWYADMALALLAAFVNLPIREARLRRAVAMA